MSYRSTRKQAMLGPGDQAIDTASVLPRVGVRSMVMPDDAPNTGAVNSLGFPIALPSNTIKEGLGDITSRLNRALGQYANDFDDDEGAEEFATTKGDMSLGRYGMEDERREFQARYQTITARVDAMARERTELMNSMAEWLESDPGHSSFPPSKESDTDGAPPSGKSLRDQLLNTKMGFDKLKQLNHEKERLDSQGKDTGLLQEESSKLQMKVIAKFKKLHESKKLEATRRSFGAHWKHASDEIVGLLRRIRSEGTDEIESLEDELERAMNGIQRQAQEMIRLEGKIREKEDMVDKWSAENAKLTNENLLLNSERDKCRDIVRKLKKALLEERRKKGTPTTSEDVDDIAEGKKPLQSGVAEIRERGGVGRVQRDQGRREGTAAVCPACCTVQASCAVDTPPTEPAHDQSVAPQHGRDEARGKDVMEDLTILKEENEWLTARVAKLEQTLIEKETHMLKLEMQLSELLEEVNASSPEILTRLTMTDPMTVNSLAQASAKRPPQPTNTMERHAKTKTSSASNANPAEGSKPTSQKARDVRAPKLSSKNMTKKQMEEPAAASSEAPVSGPASQLTTDQSTELTQITEQRDRLQGELVAVKGQLMRAQRELITLKYASNGLGVSHGGAGGGSKQITGTIGIGSQHGTMPDNGPGGSDTGLLSTGTPSEVSANPKHQHAQPIVKYDDEFHAYAALMRDDVDSRPCRRMSRPSQKDNTQYGPGGVQVARADGLDDRRQHGDTQTADDRSKMEEYVTYDQGMQTDPQMDPLGQWSNVPLIQRRRTVDPVPLLSSKDPTVDHVPTQGPPIAQPPAEWTSFDPTGPVTPATAHAKAGSVSQHMRMGQEPSKLDAQDIVMYVEREVGRIVQGINGFTAYLKRLIQREITQMITANQDIRKQLSEATLRRLDQADKESANAPTDDGRRSRGLTTPIRRGRFEVVKENKPSKFATKNAYASLQSGGRRFHHSPSPVPNWDIRCKTPTQPPYDTCSGWNTFARDHISVADEAASLAQGAPSPHATTCAYLQHQIDLLGQHAIHVLKGTTLFFKETVTCQMEEYSLLHAAFGLRHELKSLMTPVSRTSNDKEHGGADDREEKNLGTDANAEGLRADHPPGDVPLKLARSTSHNSFLESRNIHCIKETDRRHVGFDWTGCKNLAMETRSLSSIQSSHRYLPALAVYESQKPRNRHEIQIPKATLPRRGLVTLQVNAANVNIRPTQVVESKRQSRPVALSHRGLILRQRDLLNKVNPNREGALDQAEADEPLTTILELKRQLFQLQPNQTSTPINTGTTSCQDGQQVHDTRSLPPLENERRRVIIHAQDQLRVGDPVTKWDKYVGHLGTDAAKA